MVFSTSTSAFLHFGEHQPDHNAPQSYAEGHHHYGHEGESDHAHHFNLHVIGDLVEHETLSLNRPARFTSCEYSSQLISRTYTPPIPPPNA